MTDFTLQDQLEHCLGVALAQVYSLRKGLKEFGDQGKNAVQTELQQHHDMETYFPIDPSQLSKEQKRSALESLMQIVKKRDGRVRARGMADGSKQRRMAGYKKEDAASPTVHNESVFITACIDAFEGRDVMILDIPGAYLHALTKDEVYMLLRGPLAETMLMIDPELYRPFVTYDKRGFPYCM